MCRHEAKCIKDIVATISSRLSLLIANVNEDLIGIETRLHDLISKLNVGSGGVRMVGIWGVGGGGKTTLASAAYMEVSWQFEAHCFLENIREESRKHGLRKLQEKLLSRILKTDLVVEDEIEGRFIIKRRVCHKRVLVVLDDVDDLRQIRDLAGSHDWFGEGSRIIITTRDEHLLTRNADAIYEVSLLSHDEAIKLFNRHAYRENNPVEDYEMLSLNVISYAGGLPLALVILGSFLYDKDKDEWISALAKLKCIPHSKVMERLKISYDGLEPNEKELFLDIACFLRRWPIDRAMRVLDACSFHPRIGVKVLVQKSLLKVSNGIFDMHDLVEEMAHYIVREKHPNDPSKHSRVWQEEDIIKLSRMWTLRENNHIEVLAFPSYASDPSLPRIGAAKCNPPPLRLMRFIASALPDYASDPSLPYIVANMKKLRWLYWEGYPISSLPTYFQPTMLGCLIFIRGRQKRLWHGCKHLPNLKILDLRHSHFLRRTPDFNGLPCLERLILEDCIELIEVHPSIGYHEKLVYVNMRGCSVLKTFPSIIRMTKLETLDLSQCSWLQKFPDIQTSKDSLVNLHLGRTGIEVIPPTVGEFCTNLVSFNLSDCNKLKRIEGNFRLLKCLKDLNIADCSQLEKLAVDFFDKECCLEVLSLSIKSQESSSFKNLMKRIGLQSFHQHNLKLPQIPRFVRKLNLSCCHLGDEDIPSDISDLSNLEVLDLSGNNFSRLNSRLSKIQCLKFLNLSCCRSLVELPDLPSSIAILKAENCDLLQDVGDLSNYKWLWKVSFWQSNKLIGDEKVLRSILQVNAVEDRFMSVQLPRKPLDDPSSCFDYTRTLLTLQFPHNWYDDFSGFLLCTDDYTWRPCVIVIKQEMPPTDSQPDHDHWEEFDKNPESYKYAQVGYIPFGSLRHTPWWNSTRTHVTFQIDGLLRPKVGLVRRKSKLGGESMETPKATINSSEFWDKDRENKKTFEIKDDSTFSIVKIVWDHESHALLVL